MEYLSLGVNVLRKGLKNFHVSKSDFCNSINFTVIIQVDKGTFIKIESQFLPVYHVACQEVLSNGRFSEIYLSTSFVVGNFGDTVAMRLICFWKCSKFNVDSKNRKKNQKKCFFFWDKWIWIVCIHLSLLIREYLSLAVNALRKGLKNILCLRRTFATQLPSQWSLKMMKTLSLRLNQCFWLFTMSPVERSSQNGVFRELSKHVFCGP